SSPPAPWLTETLCCHRRELRTAERQRRKSRIDSDLSSYKSLLSKCSLEVTSAQSSYYREKFEESSSDPRKLFMIFSSLLNPPPPLPSSSLTPEDFTTFFEEKVAAIRQSLSSIPTLSTSVHSLASNSLTSFSPLSSDEILQLLTSSNLTTCPLDPIPSALFQTIARYLLPFISVIINNSLSSGYVPVSSQKPLDEQFIINCLFFSPRTSGMIPISLATNQHILQFGVTGSAWRWFQSYLDGRSYQ
ncbi:hypothetical protein P4O66_005781, partial [Electrophorus voltai]